MAIGNEGRDLVCYLLLLIPLEIIMTSKRVVKDGNRKKAVALAGGVLALVASVKIGFEVLHKDRSYYDMMGVRPNAPFAEIKKGYRAESLKVHPDKNLANGEEETDEAFLELKKAYDVLYDNQLRDLYNKFGEPGVENKDDTNALLAGLGFFYVTWLAVAYLLTRKKAVTRAQVPDSRALSRSLRCSRRPPLPSPASSQSAHSAAAGCAVAAAARPSASATSSVHPALPWADMELHRAARARHLRVPGVHPLLRLP